MYEVNGDVDSQELHLEAMATRTVAIESISGTRR